MQVNIHQVVNVKLVKQDIIVQVGQIGQLAQMERILLQPEHLLPALAKLVWRIVQVATKQPGFAVLAKVVTDLIIQEFVYKSSHVPVQILCN